MAKVLLLLAILGTCSASNAIDEDLRKQVAALDSLIQGQQARIESLETGDSKHEGSAEQRKLQTGAKAPSIYGGKVWDTRAYTEHEKRNGAMDSMWLIICGALVMFMQAGFAMIESGYTRFRNVENVLLKNLVDVCVGTVAWFVFGWAFAYSGDYETREKGVFKKNHFLGFQEFAGHNFLESLEDGQQEPTMRMSMWFYQWSFCTVAATIVGGAMAERTMLPAYMIYTFFMTAFIYPVVVAWTWGQGWIAELGYFDFAGSGIVHLTGGVGALVGAAIVGPRNGRFDDISGKDLLFDMPARFTPHSQPLVVLGTFILWFGWYGMTCGSTRELHTAEKGFLAAQVAMNTTISAATGGLVVVLLRFLATKKLHLSGLCQGILAGLVSISASCANVECGTAFFIGAVGALFYQAASSGIRVAKIDDPVDAFATHGACGLWGLLAAGFFDWGRMMDYGHGWSGFRCHSTNGNDGLAPPIACDDRHNGSILGGNTLEALAIIFWVGILSAIIFLILKKAKLLRYNDEDQLAGIDKNYHYPGKAYAMDEDLGVSQI